MLIRIKRGHALPTHYLSLGYALRRASFWAVLVVTSLLTACSSVEETAYIPAETVSEEMFWTGLADIQEIYIDKPVLSDLAIAGLEGLRQIEPNIQIEATDGVLKLRLPDGIAGAAKTPPEDNAYAWALTLAPPLPRARTRRRLPRRPARCL